VDPARSSSKLISSDELAFIDELEKMDYEELKKNVADFKLISKKIDDEYNVKKSKLIEEIKKKRGKNRVPIADEITALEDKHKKEEY
jgi:hypothetical protein